MRLFSIYELTALVMCTSHDSPLPMFSHLPPGARYRLLTLHPWSQTDPSPLVTNNKAVKILLEDQKYLRIKVSKHQNILRKSFGISLYYPNPKNKNYINCCKYLESHIWYHIQYTNSKF